MDLSLPASPVKASAAPAEAVPVDLAAPLPAELTGAHQGWFSRYRRYPVYSRPWAVGRMRAWGAWAGVLALALIGFKVVPLAGAGHPGVAAAGVMLVLGFGIGVPLVLGPWLAWQVRRRGLPPRREAAALVLAFAATVLVTTVMFDHVRPPIKNAISRWVEGVDAGTTVVMLNLSVRRSPPLPQAEPVTAAPGALGEAGMADPGHLSAAATLWDHASHYSLWALIILWLAGAAGLLGLQRERRALADLKRQRELQAAQQARREAELRLSVLQAQIEPHFLFNTLAGVRSAITGDPGRAVETIDRLVDYLRAAVPRLRSGGAEAQASLGGQLEGVRAYLSLMRLRLPRLSFEIDAPPQVLGAHCPPLMLLTLVENAVKHGIEPQVGPGRIGVAARLRDDTQGGPRLEVVVTDDGVGLRSGVGGSGLGLVNVRERLAQLYGDAAAFSLSSAPGGGAVATLSLPYEAAP